MPPIKWSQRVPDCDGDESQINALANALPPRNRKPSHHSNGNKSVFRKNSNFYLQKNLCINEKEMMLD